MPARHPKGMLLSRAASADASVAWDWLEDNSPLLLDPVRRALDRYLEEMEHEGDIHKDDLLAGIKRLKRANQVLEPLGLLTVGYLRRVQESFYNTLLTRALDSLGPMVTSEVCWRFGRLSDAAGEVPTMRRMPRSPYYLKVHHACLPACLLAAVLRFLKPAGTKHLAVIQATVLPGEKVVWGDEPTVVDGEY
jgi:hypothetical protein